METDVKHWDAAASNAELVDGALAGERDAWNELVRRYDGPLHQVAQSFRLDQAAMRRLPARSRTLLTLLAAAPARSYGEVSKTLGMPVGSIGPTRARGLRQLRGELEAVGIDGA
jgi:DNA-directed RNA polymerase specialized sigma24 family protein